MFIKANCESGTVLINTDHIKRIYPLSSDDHRRHVHVIDFGDKQWERVDSQERERIEALIAGTAPEMTPEQTEAEKWIDEVFPLPKPKTAMQALALPKSVMDAYQQVFNASDMGLPLADECARFFQAFQNFMNGDK